MHLNIPYRQAIALVVVFAAAYLITGALTPVFADMTVSEFAQNVVAGVSSTAEAFR